MPHLLHRSRSSWTPSRQAAEVAAATQGVDVGEPVARAQRNAHAPRAPPIPVGGHGTRQSHSKGMSRMYARNAWRVAAVVFAVALAGTLFGRAIADTTITRSARTLTGVKVVHSSTQSATYSSTWTDIPDAVTSITVPSCGRPTCAVTDCRLRYAKRRHLGHLYAQ